MVRENLVEDMSYFNKICFQTHSDAHFLSSPEERIYGVTHFSEVSAFSQIREAPRRLLSASVNSHLPSTQNNPTPR